MNLQVERREVVAREVVGPRIGVQANGVDGGEPTARPPFVRAGALRVDGVVVHAAVLAWVGVGARARVSGGGWVSGLREFIAQVLWLRRKKGTMLRGTHHCLRLAAHNQDHKGAH